MMDKYYIAQAIFKDGTNKFSAAFTDKVKCQILGNEYKKAYKKTPNKIVKIIIHELDTYEEAKQLRGHNDI